MGQGARKTMNSADRRRQLNFGGRGIKKEKKRTREQARIQR